MKMKKKLVLASKILLGIFFLLLLAVVMSVSYEADNISGVLLLLFMAVGALTVIALLIEFVLEMIEKWKETGIRSILLIPGQVVMYSVVFLICDYIIQHGLRNPLRYLVTSVIMVIAITSVNYWKRVRNQ